MINPFSNLSYLLPPLTVFVVSLILVALVWRGARSSFSSRLFLGLLLSMGLWSSFIFAMRVSPSAQQALLWERLTPVFFHVTFVLYYHFTLAYTNSKGQRGILIAAYLSLVVAAALSPTDLIIEGMSLESYGYAPVLGPMGFVMGAADLFLMGAGGRNLLKRYRVSSSPEERNRLLYLIIALLFSLLGAFLDGFSNLPPVAIWTNFIFCLMCSVAILKYHLLDMRFVARKSLAYFLVSVVVASPYVGLLFFLRFISDPMQEPWWLHVLVLVLLAIVLRPIYSWAQNLVDRLFYRDKYDNLKALEQFSQEAHDISDLDQLFSSLVKLICRALQSSSVHLLLPSRSEDFITVSSAGKNTPQLTIESDSPLLRWLRSNEGILRHHALDTIPQLQAALTAKARNELEKMRAKLFVPLKTKEKELAGILILGEKLSEQPFSEDDERLVVTVASRVAVELENARLYALERSTRRELERQGQQKTEFLHSVAHELKTPLTAIISSSELLGTERLSTTPSQRQKLIRNIRHSAWSMDKTVTELLDLAKMQVGGLELKSESLEIGVIIEEVTSQLLPLFKNKEQSVKLEVPGSLSPVKGDREKLEQILVNLLSNANKFSPAGGNITLRTREVDDRIVVEVKDSAPAITEEEKEKLFDAYYRGDTKRRRIPGLGLGLAICRKLVELHQGRIWVESEPGEGNIFAFSLPTWNMDKGD